MENKKINIAEILKDCPRGMELDCTMYDNVYFDRIVKENGFYNIECYTLYNNIKKLLNFSSFGTISVHQNAECVIFPKGKTTWEGFEPPCEFKDGDIVYFMCNCGDEYTAIFKKMGNKYLCTYIDYNCGSFTGISDCSFEIEYIKEVRLSTEEEKRKFFDVIKENNYHWNAETKTLDILIEPKFKVGDRIVHSERGGKKLTIDGVYITIYGTKELDYGIPIENQDEYELVPEKFDINTLVPFESRVLVRQTKNSMWKPGIFGCYAVDTSLYYTLEHVYWKQCIPYEGNEHLCGKKDDCSEYFKIWEE